ncbi:methionine--tRNA ligase subunit beta [Candidatus Pacearchaeota archaeon]|jgi:methionyl-tRNA synthetase|nr:methionine--tRNA ligase subunit beta [Candidatus Pacearchaeota archaeon]|tara:strand:+ start:1518 stop:1853 length:336 start_codon:yes stop_codon:yes gene_type:complete
MTDKIPFTDFAKLDLRVAQIKKAEEIEGKDKLLKLEIDLGDEQRTIVAGIKQHYDIESLKDKKIVIIANLEPAKLGGVESNGMLLAAVSDDHSSVTLLTPDQDAPAGTKVS